MACRSPAVGRWGAGLGPRSAIAPVQGHTLPRALLAYARGPAAAAVCGRVLLRRTRRLPRRVVTVVCVSVPQPNALLGARSNVARISQRGPHMLLAGEGLRSARAMPLLPQATESKPTHVVTKMASSAGEKKGGVDIQLIAYFALWYLGNYYCTCPRAPARRPFLASSSPAERLQHVHAACAVRSACMQARVVASFGPRLGAPAASDAFGQAKRPSTSVCLFTSRLSPPTPNRQHQQQDGTQGRRRRGRVPPDHRDPSAGRGLHLRPVPLGLSLFPRATPFAPPPTPAPRCRLRHLAQHWRR